MIGSGIRVALVIGSLSLAANAWSAPCIQANSTCTEWISFPGGPSRSVVYRTYSLTEKNANITRALVMVHGANRDADNYFRTAVGAAFLGSALEDTVVVAPRMASNDGRGCKDTLAPNEVSWNCGSWRSGGPAINNNKVDSFLFVDEILRKLAKKEVFPNLREIVVAGHSAGGQFVTRYEMANKVHDELGVPITYVVSNPSSYAYPDAVRPNAEATDFVHFRDARNCTTYDKWPYGFEDRTEAGYTAKMSDDQLRKQLTSRPVTYLLGEIDILPLGGFDSSCPAMAQGPTRLARGQAFAKLVNTKLGAKHNVTVVPLCGHNARCMFTSEAALPLIFPPAAAKTSP
ncbi:MAG: alpha/beta fold hydrolase [Acidobacteriaceae bacterium]|nr:alpha/beta fold hydrolase [Acidobacteriaceae bacterium]